jgi:glucokinase
MSASGLVAGLDLGGTKILGRVVDPRTPGEAIASVRIDTPRGGAAILDALADAVAQLRAADAVAAAGDVAAVGIGAAGLVDLRGVLRFAPNLPSVVDLDIGPALRERFDLPVVVDNDANCATVAEHRLGAAVEARSATLVTLGTGIGAGLIVDGELQRGAAGFAGEPGHMVVDPTGPPCPCGRRGCWERFASGSGLGRLARDAAQAGRADRVVTLAGGDPDDVRGEHVTAAVAEGDPDALVVLRDFAWWVALGIANLVNVLDPEVVVIGGGLVAAGDALIGPTRAAYAGLVLAHDHRPPVRIVAAELGPEAGAIGAALLAGDLGAAAPPPGPA